MSRWPTNLLGGYRHGLGMDPALRRQIIAIEIGAVELGATTTTADPDATGACDDDPHSH